MGKWGNLVDQVVKSVGSGIWQLGLKSFLYHLTIQIQIVLTSPCCNLPFYKMECYLMGSCGLTELK